MQALKMYKKISLMALALVISACSEFYRDEVQAPTEQEVDSARQMLPYGALKSGVFHMQRVQTGSSVRVKDRIELKRPDLPAFDVAYIGRDLESVILELANAAGESVVIPQGIRGRTITLVHSGANFQDLLTLVLGKAGYHYNYTDGIWYITRYPIRSYVLEIGQSERKGGLSSSAEIGAESDGNAGTTDASGPELTTEYNDTLWKQVEGTVKELIAVGANDLKKANYASSGNAGDTPKVEAADLVSGDIEDEVLEVLSDSGSIRPFRMDAPSGNDHLLPEEDAEPWYKITKSAGLLTVRAAPEAHRLIEEYLDQVQSSSQRQILVEARIVAIIKDKTTDRGSDFEKSKLGLGGDLLGKIGFKATTPITQSDIAGGFLSMSSAKGDINLLVQAMSKIGDVYTISSPSLLARNNQISRVSITRQLGYAETEVEQNTTAAGDVVVGNRTDKAKFKNSGTVMSIMPFIGKQKVQMRLRMSVASKVGDTSIQTAIGDDDPITNLVPELANNVIDQDMVLEYGRVYAIGGMIETSTSLDYSYIPGLNQIPGLSEVFQRAKNQKQDTEFVVLLKVSRS